MEGTKLDLSLLDNLNIPQINIKTETSEQTDENQILKTENIESVDQNLITEELDSDIIDDELQEDDDNSKKDDEVEESAIKLWAEFASERGLMDIEDGEEIEDSEEFLIKKYNQKVEKAVESYKKSLPEDLRTILEAYETGVPLNDYLEAESRIADYSSVDADKLKEDVKLQKDIMKAYLRAQEYEDSEIEAKIEKYEENLLLEDEASHALKKLVKIEQRQKDKMLEEAKNKKANYEKQYEERLTNFKNSVMGKEEIIKGIPVTKEQREAIIDLTTKPVAITKDGVPITALKKMELEDPDFLIKLAYMASLNWDLSTIQRKANTEAVRKVKKGVDSDKSGDLPSKIDLNIIRKAIKQNRNSFFTKSSK